MEAPKTTLTVAQIRATIKEAGIDAPLGLRKAELLLYLEGVKKAKLLPTPVYSTSSDYTNLVAKWAKPDLTWQQHLTKYGWATLALPELDTERCVSELYDLLEGCSPVSLEAIKEAGNGARNYPRLSMPKFKRENSLTWTNKNIPTNLHGIVKQYFGHTSLQWYVRELCVPIWEEIHGTNELLVSFDGMCFLKPLEVLNGKILEVEVSDEPAIHKYKQWLHLDQDKLSEFTDKHSPHIRSCVQGLVNLLNCGPEDGGLVLVERSHRRFAGYFDRHPTDGFGWFKVDMSDPELSQLPVIKVCAPAGHLVLWDSRMVHANCPPSGQSTLKPRMCLYISMQPRAYATEKEIAKRIKLFETGRQTGHNTSGHLFKETAKHPRSYGNAIVMPKEPFYTLVLSPVARRLVGYTD